MICDIVWTDQIDALTFEDKWTSIINDFDIQNNEWLFDIYEMRESWIPTYYRDEHLSGLMRTLSRSESENHCFGQLSNCNLTLVEFIRHFDTAMDAQRYKFDKNSHDTRYTNLKTNLSIEKEDAQLYTRTIFYDVQDEIFCSLMHCMCLNVRDDGFHRYFLINDNKSDFSRRRGDKQTRFEVSFNSEDQSVECSCKRFECFGLLCRHNFYVLRKLNISNFPKRYLLSRWSIDALSCRMGRSVMDLKSIGDKVHNRRLLAKTVRSHLCWVLSEPSEVNIKVPQGIRNKASGSKKRLKSKREEEIEKLKKSRYKKYKGCITYVKDHDSRNCPSKSSSSASKRQMIPE